MIKGEELTKIAKYKKLINIGLAGNPIKEFEQLEPLKDLDLIQLDLYNCPITNKENYREKIFETFKNLKVFLFFYKDLGFER